jgi:hypothetical protein
LVVAFELGIFRQALKTTVLQNPETKSGFVFSKRIMIVDQSPNDGRVSDIFPSICLKSIVVFPFSVSFYPIGRTLKELKRFQIEFWRECFHDLKARKLSINPHESFPPVGGMMRGKRPGRWSLLECLEPPLRFLPSVQFETKLKQSSLVSADGLR